MNSIERRDKLRAVLGEIAYSGCSVRREAGEETIGGGDQEEERYYERIWVKIPPTPHDEPGKKAFSPDFYGKKLAEFGFEIDMIYADEEGAVVQLEHFMEDDEFKDLQY